MPAEVETMAYATDARGGVWHGIGTPVDHAMTVEEALTLARLDWTVSKEQLYYNDQRPAPDTYGIRRSTDGKHLGTVGHGYVPWQNVDGLNWLNNLLQDGSIRLETAISLFGGSRVVLLARLHDDWTVGPDQHYSYMCVMLGHDGKYSVHLFGTDVRVVCANTAKMATGTARKNGNLIRVRHSASMQDKLRIASDALNIETGEQKRYQEWLNKSLATPIARDDVEEFMVSVFGDPAEAATSRVLDNIKQERSLFSRCYLTPEFNRTGQTAYTLFNAATGYADYALQYRAGKNSSLKERRFVSAFDGRGASIKDTATSIIDKLIGVPA